MIDIVGGEHRAAERSKHSKQRRTVEIKIAPLHISSVQLTSWTCRPDQTSSTISNPHLIFVAISIDTTASITLIARHHQSITWHPLHSSTTHYNWATTISMLRAYPFALFLSFSTPHSAPNYASIPHRARPRNDRERTTDKLPPSHQWTAWSISTWSEPAQVWSAELV